MNSAAALQQVNSAQNELDTLLASGSGTFDARKKLKEAQTELSLIEQKENQNIAAFESQKKSARQHEAVEIIASITTDLNKKLENLVNIQTPVLNIPVHLATNVLLAHERLSASQEKQREQGSCVAELRQRQRELQAKRNDIVNRRAAGNGDDAIDGPSLALIQADGDNLTILIEKKINSIQVVDTTLQERAVGEAQIALSAAVNFAYIECLHNLALQLESSLVATAQSLISAPGILAKNRYAPCAVLKEACLNSIF